MIADAEVPMGIFRRTRFNHLVPLHPDNAKTKDWVILLEAATVVGPTSQKLRVARATLERTTVKRRRVFRKVERFLAIEGFDPRIHAVYFCPQLYKYDADNKLVPLQGEEIGTLIAQALAGGVSARRPWYEPSEKLPDQPIVDASLPKEFDSVVVELPNARNFAAPR
jgi:hypothetical protein